jgi:hypothetical protein
VLIARTRSGRTEHRDRIRARIVRAAAAGVGNTAIATELGLCVDTARRWRRQFAETRYAPRRTNEHDHSRRRIGRLAGRVGCPRRATRAIARTSSQSERRPRRRPCICEEPTPSARNLRVGGRGAIPARESGNSRNGLAADAERHRSLARPSQRPRRATVLHTDAPASARNPHPLRGTSGPGAGGNSGTPNERLAPRGRGRGRGRGRATRPRETGDSRDSPPRYRRNSGRANRRLAHAERVTRARGRGDSRTGNGQLAGQPTAYRRDPPRGRGDSRT